jgi:1-acyl-sn-glycerol-3-phosphate acyltransferase
MLSRSSNASRSSNSRTLTQRVGYDLIRVVARAFAVLVYGLRVVGRENWPQNGGGLICANHQSVFDPPLVGLTCERRMNYLARDTLFRVPILAPLIRFLDAIPIDREGMGLSGIKETLRRLKAGELVLIFPEGTRTRDGEMGPLKPGFISLARRGGVPLIPVGFDGAYQAWPRTARFPRFGRIAVVIGEPISPEQISAASDEELLVELELRIRKCHTEARGQRSEVRSRKSER